MAGNWTGPGDYRGAIVVALDTYKDPNNINEKGVAWSRKGETIKLRGNEVWYKLSGESTDYKGEWDASYGNRVGGKIIDYAIKEIKTINNVVNVSRTMGDGKLVYSQDYILEPRAPWLKIILRILNNTTETMVNVRVSLALDSMESYHYQVAYLPGIGYINASINGTTIDGGREKEYHLAYSWEEKWRPITDIEGRSWYPSLAYSRDPLGMNRAVLVLVSAGYGVHLWSYGVFVDGQWYFHRLKYEIVLGDLQSHEMKTVEIRIIPMSSYAPGLEDLVIDMARRMYLFKGRDWSYAVNTGTGAFKGLAQAYSNNQLSNTGYVLDIFDSLARVLDKANWRMQTRILANYIQGLLYLYNYTGEDDYLLLAEKGAEVIIKSQIRDPTDPRDGGFLDYPPPIGKATYLDVNAEVASALLMLAKQTGNHDYMEPINYMINHWFHYDVDAGWYYYRYGGVGEAPGEYWHKGFLAKEQPYALGYFLEALSSYYWNNSIVLEAASRIWSLITSDYWVKVSDDSNMTNVETQSSATLGLSRLLKSQLAGMGATVEYVHGGYLSSIKYQYYNDQSSHCKRYGKASLQVTLDRISESPVIVVLYIPYGIIDQVNVSGRSPQEVNSLADLEAGYGDIYYYNETNHILYVKLTGSDTFMVTYYISGRTKNASSIICSLGERIGLVGRLYLLAIIMGIVIVIFLLFKYRKN
ncbi:MAG: hypothetical protein F7B19_05620 [Desulfurococcales archaeon]|nr:hypothetical protein [Desulfurococcales archaeon]